MEVINNMDLVIVAEMTKDLTKKWSIKELAASIEKHYRPTYAAVQKLIQEKKLIKNSNNLIEPMLKSTLIYEIAEKKRLSEMQNKTLKIIKNKLDSIDDSFFSVILFGSSVYKAGKDFDLLVIIPNHKDIEPFYQSIKKALGSFFPQTNLNIINENSCFEMLNKPHELNVMNEILKNHLALIGVENFYRILKRWRNDN